MVRRKEHNFLWIAIFTLLNHIINRQLLHVFCTSNFFHSIPACKSISIFLAVALLQLQIHSSPYLQEYHPTSSEITLHHHNLSLQYGEQKNDALVAPAAVDALVSTYYLKTTVPT